MATIQRNLKTAGTRSFANEVAAGATTARAAEVDADFDTVYGEVNGQLSNANIIAAAGIATSKIAADGGITNAYINAAAAIAGTKLAVGASTLNVRTATPVSLTGLNGLDAETDLATLSSMTTRGGWVVLCASIWGQVAFTAEATNSNAGVLRAKLYRGVTVIRTYDYSLFQQNFVAAGVAALTVPAPVQLIYAEQPAAGAYVYKVTLSFSSSPAATCNWGVETNPGFFLGIEFA